MNPAREILEGRGLQSLGKAINNLPKSIDHAVSAALRQVVYSGSKVENNKLFMMNYDNGFTDNGSYIVEALLKRNLPIDVVVVGPKKGVMKGVERLPANVRIVARGTVEMFQEQSTAKVWLDNALNCVWFYLPKKNDQVYINTWHGSMGIKRLGGNEHWFRMAARCKDVTDYCITNSTFEEQVFRTTFWPDTPFLRFGHARNDLLLDAGRLEDARRRVLSFFGLPDGVRLCLYAPTFRDSGDTSCFDVDYAALREALAERFGGDWAVLVRMHYKNRKVAERVEYGGRLLDATGYGDMQELMAGCDAGVTDYSSWAYDYVLTGRPLFLYIPDIDRYDQDRGFYYPIEQTPFPRAYSRGELAERVRGFDGDAYAARVAEFLEARGCYETGRAAEMAADKIQEVMGL